MNESTYTIDLAELMRGSLDDLELLDSADELAEYAGELAAIDSVLAEQEGE